MGGPNETRMKELSTENERLKSSLVSVESALRQSEVDRLQVQTSYEEALQALADSEAKRETIDKELKLAHNQITSMWSELASLRKQLDGPVLAPPTITREGSPPQLDLYCTLCKERINSKTSNSESSSSNGKQASPEGSPKNKRSSWLSFGRKPR